jgi:hypothetical protein
MWSQIDAGVAITLGVILEVAAIRKLQRPREFALTLQRLEPSLLGHRAGSIRLGVGIAVYEMIAGAGVVAFRGAVGFGFACAVVAACAAFLVALVRAVQESVPCACFGRLGRTAAGGREIARGIALLAGAAFLVVNRAVEVNRGYGVGVGAGATVVAALGVILVAQRIGVGVRPGVEVGPEPDGGRSIATFARSLVGYDNDLYSSGA